MREKVSTARATSQARTICILNVTSRETWRSMVDAILCPIRRHLPHGWRAPESLGRPPLLPMMIPGRRLLMRAAGYRPPRLLNGGYQAYLQAGGEVVTLQSVAVAAPVEQISGFAQSCDIAGVRTAQGYGALLIDSREPARYCGEEEPIDPVAGHIPGARNRPWQAVTDDCGRLLDLDHQRAHWGDVLDAEHLLVYCGSGVTACVNLFSLAVLGRHDALLYAGSWSDWCSYLSDAGSP
jgi:3-mercaptopyruvate sulfurtransferase SseA